MSNQSTNEQNRSAHSSERSIFLPHGRIGRVAYGMRWAFVLAAYAILGSVQQATTGSEPGLLMKCLFYVLFAFWVLTSIKRLHDLGYGAVAVIFLGPIIPLLLFAPGERGSNAYGSPPAEAIRWITPWRKPKFGEMMRQFMKRIQIIGLLFVAWFACSQDLVSIIEPPLAFNMAVRVAYSQTNDFRADAVLNLPGPSGSRLLFPVTYEKCGSKIATSLWFTNLTFLPEQVKTNLVLLSLNEIRAIADIETREVVCVFPGTKTYVVVPPSPKMESLFDLKSHPSKRHVVGTEVLDGVRCQKVELFEEGQPSARGIAWERDDPHRSLVRVDVQDRSGTMNVIIKSFEVKSPGGWAISVPTGFRRYSNSLEIVNAAILAARTSQALPTDGAQRRNR